MSNESSKRLDLGDECFGGAAIGLLIEDSISERVSMMAILCGRPQLRPSMGSLLVPPQAVTWDMRRAAKQDARLCEPIACELFYFAREMAGGVAIRRNDWSHDQQLPTIIVVKKVRSSDWDVSVQSAAAWLGGSKACFGKYIGDVAMVEHKQPSNPGNVLDLDLLAFRKLVMDMAHRSALGSSMISGPMRESRSKPPANKF